MIKIIILSVFIALCILVLIASFFDFPDCYRILEVERMSGEKVYEVQVSALLGFPGSWITLKMFRKSPGYTNPIEDAEKYLKELKGRKAKKTKVVKKYGSK